MVSYITKVTLSAVASSLCVGFYDVYSYWKKHQNQEPIVLAGGVILAYYGLIGGVTGLTLGYLTNY